MSHRRRATPSTCPRCRAVIVVGLDSDRCALTAYVDPVPLTHRGELLAVVDGRHTYGCDLGLLYHRDAFTIANPAIGHAVAEHVCGRPVPAGWAAPPIAPPTQAVDHEEPGF